MNLCSHSSTKGARRQGGGRIPTDRHGIPVLTRPYDPEPGGRDCSPVCNGRGWSLDPFGRFPIPCPCEDWRREWPEVLRARWEARR